MKHLAHVGALVAALAFPAPIFAQQAEPDTGRSLMSRGFQMMMEGLFKEAEPALEELQDFAENLEPWMREFAENAGPALKELMEEIGDLSQYEAPERLPNGDIILRRKLPDPPETVQPDEKDSGNVIDL